MDINDDKRIEGIERAAHLGGGTWTLNNLGKINVLLGRNGSGKSILLRALRDKLQADAHYIVPERTGDITFSANLLESTSTSRGRQGHSENNWSRDYRQLVVTRLQAYLAARGTKNVNDLGEIDPDPGALLQSLSAILPDFVVTFQTETPHYKLARVKGETSVNSVVHLSSGEAQLFSIGLDIITIIGMWNLDNKHDRTLLIDEPDAHIHADLQISFSDFLCKLARQHNVRMVVATHSTTLLSALGQFGKEDTRVIFLSPDQRDLKARSYDAYTREVASFLGGHLMMGTLCASPIMLVEGDDDYRIWVQVARCGGVDICVLPCNGEEIRKYRSTIDSMFSALSNKTKFRGIALLDGDKPSQSEPSDGSIHIPYVKLRCRESENLYLADEVLQDMGYADWNEAVQKVKKCSSNYGNKEQQLIDVVEMDRENGDFKSVIHQIAQVLDPKNLLWTVRLGNLLGRGRPNGQLAEFLGPDVVQAI